MAAEWISMTFTSTRSPLTNRLTRHSRRANPRDRSRRGFGCRRYLGLNKRSPRSLSCHANYEAWHILGCYVVWTGSRYSLNTFGTFVDRLVAFGYAWQHLSPRYHWETLTYGQTWRVD
jgi:hypothetical protein